MNPPDSPQRQPPEASSPPARVPKLLGHPWHSAVVHFPMAAFAAPLPLDVMGCFASAPEWWLWSRVIIGVGLAAGLLAGMAGLMDLATIPDHSPASRVGLRHMVTMVGAIGVFAVDGALRLEQPVPVGGMRVLIVALSALGLAMVLLGGWLGGELVYRYQIGHEERAPQVQSREET